MRPCLTKTPQSTKFIYLIQKMENTVQRFERRKVTYRHFDTVIPPTFRYSELKPPYSDHCLLQGASVQLPPCPQLQAGHQGCVQHGGGAGRHGGARHHRGLRQAAPLQLQQVPRAAAVHRAQQDPRGLEVWHSVTIIIV